MNRDTARQSYLGETFRTVWIFNALSPITLHIYFEILYLEMGHPAHIPPDEKSDLWDFMQCHHCENQVCLVIIMPVRMPYGHVMRDDTLSGRLLPADLTASLNQC